MIAFTLSSWLLLPSSLLASVLAIDSVPAYNQSIDDGALGFYPVHSYATEESLVSPIVNWLQWNSSCDDGRLIFLTPRGGEVDQPGPIILDAVGDLVWAKTFQNEFGGQAYNLQVQRYRGEDYLTFWLGDDAVRGHGAGLYHMLNSSYDIIHTVAASGNLSADLHEFVITPEGTALLTVYDVVPFDLTTLRANDPSNRPPKDVEVKEVDRNWIWDCLIQEVSIDTGELLFEWRASEHLNVSETYHDIQDRGSKDWAFDWLHINSVLKDESGNYLISARYTHSITYIDGRTGDILWTLGGKRNDFMDLSDGKALNFAWQHDARFHALDAFPDNYAPRSGRPHLTRKLLTIFDNAAEDLNYSYGSDVARGMLLELTYPTSSSAPVSQATQRLPAHDILNARDRDEEKIAAINGSNPDYTVRLIQEYENPRGMRSSSQGSLQVLPPISPHESTKTLVGFGLNAVWTEFDANGTILCDAHYGSKTSWELGHIQSYRTYKFPWIGRPRTSPKLVQTDDGLAVYASWNGATEVRYWILQGSESRYQVEGGWYNITRAPKTGFETGIDLSSDATTWPYLRVLAQGHAGSVLDHGTSEVIRSTVGSIPFGLNINNFIERVLELDLLCVLIVVIASIVTLLSVYRLVKMWQDWRHGRNAVGRFRWRKGVCYDVLHGEL